MMKTSFKLLSLCSLLLSASGHAYALFLNNLNAGQLIQQALADEGAQECILATGNPVQFYSDAISIPHSSDKPGDVNADILNALVSQNLLYKTTGMNTDSRGLMSLGSEYHVTSFGQQYLSESSMPGYFYFCSGQYKVTGIRSINQGVGEDGRNYSVVEYTYQVVNAARWMQSREILQANEDNNLYRKLTRPDNVAHATLIETLYGWEVVSTTDVHDV